MLNKEELDKWLELERELDILDKYRKYFNLYGVIGFDQ